MPGLLVLYSQEKFNSERYVRQAIFRQMTDDKKLDISNRILHSRYAKHFMQTLNTVFGDRAISCSLWSLLLTLLCMIYSCELYLKDEVYQTVHTWKKWRKNIHLEVSCMSREQLQCVSQNLFRSHGERISQWGTFPISPLM